MHASVMEFVTKSLPLDLVRDKDVLEVGSYNVNGSVREILEPLGPRSYTGIDVVSGPGVDVVCPAENIKKHFEDREWDIVISTEMLEHAENWRTVVEQMRRAVRPGGLLLVTARGPGFAYHNPPDHWRFTLTDFANAFSQRSILLALMNDPQAPGVFVLARVGREAMLVDIEPMKMEQWC